MKPLAADDPRVIGEYRLRAQLGAGGMGRVYLGLSPAGRAVAIKVVHPELASDAAFLRRFSQEIAAARAVSGIYTAPVVASGLNERPPWLATAFVPGPSLDQVVAEHGPLPEQALWPLFGGLVEALEAIHACGGGAPRPQARERAAGHRRTAGDRLRHRAGRRRDRADGGRGGVRHARLHVARAGGGLDAGPASDVFALGCVVAFAAAGMGPFGTGTAAAVMYRVVHAEPVLDEVPARLREVIAACLAKDRAARPALRTLAGAISSRLDATGPSAVAFWPPAVAGLIGAYQARLELQTRSSGRPAGADGFSWAAAGHARTTPSDPPGHNRPGPSGPPPAAPSPPPQWPRPGDQGPQKPQGPQGPQGPGPRWPHPGTGGMQASAGSQAVAAGSPAYPAPRGYLPANGAPAAGHPANGAAAAGRRRPHQAGSRGATPPLPASMVTAVRLMYTGAAFAVVWAIGTIAVWASIVRQHPIAADHRLAGAVALAVILSAVDVALWLGIARACRRGRSGARVAGTVLFALHTLGVLSVVASAQAGLGPAKVLTLIGWLIGLGAVVALWQRPSSAFFTAQASPNR